MSHIQRYVTLVPILIYADRSGLVSGLIEFLDNPIAEAEHKAREDIECDNGQLNDVKPTCGRFVLSLPNFR